MFATFSSFKDYESYTNAAIKVLDRRNDTTFLAVGDGIFTKYLKKVPSKYSHLFLFLGLQKNVESLMNICDIGVLASFTEGISNSLIELMALGKPVIATGSGGTKELIQHGMNGYLLLAQKPEKLANSIFKLLEENKTRFFFHRGEKNNFRKV
jgi:glycosyltransferase involved in cell wall biosynthesis